MSEPGNGGEIVVAADVRNRNLPRHAASPAGEALKLSDRHPDDTLATGRLGGGDVAGLDPPAKGRPGDADRIAASPMLKNSGASRVGVLMHNLRAFPVDH